MSHPHWIYPAVIFIAVQLIGLIFRWTRLGVLVLPPWAIEPFVSQELILDRLFFLAGALPWVLMGYPKVAGFIAAMAIAGLIDAFRSNRKWWSLVHDSNV